MALGRELTIGQVADRTGMAVSAIRYYEAQGLITAERNAGGHRRYERSVIRLLSFIQIAQQFGITLAQIRDELDKLPHKGPPSPEDWASISLGFRDVLNEKIDTLSRLRDNLEGCIGCGCLSMEKCALYNAKDAAAQKGAGPRYLMGDRPSAGG